MTRPSLSRIKLFGISLVLLNWPLAALAGVPEAIENHALPRVHSFAVQTKALEVNAMADCTAEALRPSFQNAFDAWMGISHLTFGPLEVNGRGLAIGFWPDKRGMVGSTVAQLVRDEDKAVESAEAFAEVSVAGRGLFALELLLYDQEFAGYSRDSYTCRLVQAEARDLARMAAEVDTDWARTAELMRTAGEAGNPVYLSPREPAQQFYTVLMAGLEFTADQRLGRPMGTFDKPRPERAEARRSGRSLRNIELSLAALKDLAEKLAVEPIPVTEEAFARAMAQAQDLQDPVLEGVSDPSGRLKVEIVQQSTRAVQDAVAGEIGAHLGVTEGFNSADGD